MHRRGRIFKKNFLPGGFGVGLDQLERMNHSPGVAHPMVISLV
jgi:hypothetical protein